MAVRRRLRAADLNPWNAIRDLFGRLPDDPYLRPLAKAWRSLARVVALVAVVLLVLFVLVLVAFALALGEIAKSVSLSDILLSGRFAVLVGAALAALAVWTVVAVRPLTRAYARTCEGDPPGPAASAAAAAVAGAVAVAGPVALGWCLLPASRPEAWMLIGAMIATAATPSFALSAWRLARA